MTVFEPAAICVRPASRTRLTTRPRELACEANCILQHKQHNILIINNNNNNNTGDSRETMYLFQWVWRSSDNNSMALYWSPPNWTSATSANFVFNS